MTVQSPSFGPGKLTQPGETGGPNFVLSGTQWQVLQSFTNSALGLPTTMDALKTQLGSGAPSDMSDCKRLVTAYLSLWTLAHNFTMTLYPNIVRRAGDIANYGNQIGSYYRSQ